MLPDRELSTDRGLPAGSAGSSGSGFSAGIERSARRILAVARANFLLQARDPVAPILMVAIPLILTPFLLPGARLQLRADGYLHASGAEQALPGFAVLFAFLSCQQVITLFFREYAWGTWDRLRVSAASITEVMLGKTAVAFLVQLLQLAAVIALGAVLFGYRANGSLLALGLVCGVFSLTLACLGLMLVALVDSLNLALSISNLAGMLMAGLGGAIAPVASFPGWAASIAKVSPAYWALDAIRRVSLERAGVGDVITALLVLFAFTIVFVTVAALRFRVDANKTGDT